MWSLAKLFGHNFLEENYALPRDYLKFFHIILRKCDQNQRQDCFLSWENSKSSFHEGVDESSGKSEGICWRENDFLCRPDLI